MDENMNKCKGMELQPLTENDIGPLTEIMTRAFDHDTKLHVGEEKGSPEGYDDGSLLRKYGLNSPTKSEYGD